MKNFIPKLTLIFVVFNATNLFAAGGGTPPPPAPPPPPGAPIDSNIYLLGLLVTIYAFYFFNKRLATKK